MAGLRIARRFVLGRLRALGIFGVVPATVGEFVLVVDELDLNAPVFAVHGFVGRHVAQRVIARAVVDRMHHRVAQSIAAIEGVAAGIFCQFLHGDLIGGAIRALFLQISLLHPRSGEVGSLVGRVSRQARGRNRVDGHLARGEQLGSLLQVPWVVVA
jgi:hypothetical protein